MPPLVTPGFVSGAQRPGLDESCYIVPDVLRRGDRVPAIRLEAVLAYVPPDALDDIKDFIEWRMAQERSTEHAPHPARPQLVR